MTTLYPYQTAATKRLLSLEPTQKGLLVWQAGGTGKTLTGLSFLANLPHLTSVVVLPSVGTDFWKAEAKKAGLTSVADRTKLVTYDRSHRTKFIDFLASRRVGDLEKTVIVFDEAHHLVDLIRNLSHEQRIRVFSKLAHVKKLLLVTSTPLTAEDADFRVLLNIAAGKEVLPLSTAAFKAQYYRVSKFQAAFFSWYLAMLNGLYNASANSLTELTNSYEILFSGDDSNLMNIQQLAIADPTGVLAQAIPLLTNISRWATTQLKRHKLNKLFKLDKTELAQVCMPYVLYYGVPADVPKVDEKLHTVEYTPHQIDLWVRFLFGKLESAEQRYLGVVDGRRPLTGDLMSIDMYREVGRSIGNIAEAGKFPPKFTHILQEIKDQQAVIYSSYRETGTQLMQRFLVQEGIRFSVLTPKTRFREKTHVLKMFGDKRVQVLILDPDFYEVAPIIGASQLHIMEPLLQLSRLQHVISRVVNPRSRLEKGITKVVVHRWVCTTQSLLAVASKITLEQTVFEESRSPYIQDMTPDALVHVREAIQLETADDIKQAVQKAMISYEKMVKDPSCRLYTDKSANKSLPLCAEAFH